MHIMKEGQVPHTRHVRGSNYAFISIFEDRLPGRAIVICGERLMVSWKHLCMECSCCAVQWFQLHPASRRCRCRAR